MTMNTIFLGGVKAGSSFRVVGKPYVLGQALTKTDRDHYLVALERGLAEADEIAAWLDANPTAKLKPTDAEVSSASGIVISPYFSKWVNFLAARPDMVALRDRLKSEDPASWTSITDKDHLAYGWVSVVDMIHAAFKADPKNLTAGKWVSGVRQPDPIGTGVAPLPAAPESTILGMQPKTAAIVGGVVFLSVCLTIWQVAKN